MKTVTVEDLTKDLQDLQKSRADVAANLNAHDGAIQFITNKINELSKPDPDPKQTKK